MMDTMDKVQILIMWGEKTFAIAKADKWLVCTIYKGLLQTDKAKNSNYDRKKGRGQEQANYTSGNANS